MTEESGECDTFLFIGLQGSGKSHAAFAVANTYGKRVVILNDDGKPKPTDKPFTRIEFDEVPGLRDVVVIVEDLSRTTKANMTALLQLVNVYARKRGIPALILVTHVYSKDNVGNLVKSCKYFCFMAKRTTVRCLKNVLQDFSFSKSQKEDFVARFLADSRPYGHWTLDMNRGGFSQEESPSPSPSSSAAGSGGSKASSQPASGRASSSSPLEHLKTADEYLGLFCSNPEKAKSIFGYLLRKLPLSSIDPSDLTLTLQSVRNKHIKKFSVIDYIHMVCMRDGVPSAANRSLHRHILRCTSLPLCFIANTRLQKDTVNYASEVIARRTTQQRPSAATGAANEQVAVVAPGLKTRAKVVGGSSSSSSSSNRRRRRRGRRRTRHK